MKTTDFLGGPLKEDTHTHIYIYIYIYVGRTIRLR